MNVGKIRNFGGILGLVIGSLGLAFGVYATINPDGVAKFMESSNMTLWLPFVIIALVLIPFVPYLINIIKNSAKKNRLRKVGQKTTAKILNVEDTGVTVNGVNPYVQITVEVKPGVQGTFQVLVSRVNFPRPGDNIDVIYDPADPSVVMAAD